jgi:hypothetical protein
MLGFATALFLTCSEVLCFGARGFLKKSIFFIYKLLPQFLGIELRISVVPLRPEQFPELVFLL